MEEFDDDDFGDLYADVEVQASSAINAIQTLTQLSLEDEEIYDNFPEANVGVGGENAAAAATEKEMDGGRNGSGNESGDETESKDDFGIVLNDNNDNGTNDDEKMKGGFQSGENGGGLSDEEDNEGNYYGVENGAGRAEREGCSGGGYGLQQKYMRSRSAAFSSNLKSNGSIGVTSYTSTLVRSEWEDDGCANRFRISSVRAQSAHNFSLPRSRTILDVNIDSLEQKPWRHPGADITAFFNFGFDEDSWKQYCNHLERFREQTTSTTGNPAYKHARHSKGYAAGSSHEEAVCEAVAEHFACFKQKRTVSPADRIRNQQPEMPKGRAILVEDGMGERRPSADVRHTVERDPDVVIQVPVQDWEEDQPDSDKVAFDKIIVSEKSDSGGASKDMLSFSTASEDEPPIFEGPKEGTSKSSPDRGFRHESTSDCIPACSDSDNCGSLRVSDAYEQQNQLTHNDADGTSQALKASDDPKRSFGRVKQPASPCAKKLGSSHGEPSQHIPSLSPSRNHYVASRVSAHAEPDESRNHSKRLSLNSASELQESVIFDFHSLKDSRSCGTSTRSGDQKHISRSRSPVRKFQNRKSRILGLKSYLDGERASHMSDGEKFYDVHHPTVGHGKQRNKRNGFDCFEGKDYSYYGQIEHSFRRGGARSSNYQPAAKYGGYPCRKGCQDFDHEGDQCHNRKKNGKQHFLEQSIPSFSDEVMERNWHHYERGFPVQEMDSLNYVDSTQLNTEQSPIFDGGNSGCWERKAEELYFKRRARNDEFLPECNYSNEFSQEKYRSISYNDGERDYRENKYDIHLPYSRREVKSPVRSRGRYTSPLNGIETTWQTDGDGRSRYTGNRLSFCSYRECRTAGRGRDRPAAVSRSCMFERNGRQRKQNYVESYRGSINLDGYVDGFDNNESVKSIDDIDDFVRRRQYWKPELLHWTEEEYSSRHLDGKFQGEGSSYPFERASRCKRFDIKHCTVGGKPIDGRESGHRKYKLSREDESCSQFVCSSDIVHREKFGLTTPRSQGSTDSRIVVGDGKSSRCFEAGGLVHYGRDECMDWNDDLEQETFKDLDEFCLENVVQAGNAKIDTCRDDANWCDKFPDAQRNDSVVIEEGQIVNENDENKAERNAVVEGHENPRIMEILAKMEKRRERFKQPITLNVSENTSKLFADNNAEITEIKPQRPVRKRKWIGS